MIIPARDAETTLSATLAALGCQRGAPSFEVIVVDDGSRDQTPAIAEHHGATLLQQAQKGPAAARNLGVARAAGKFVALLGADTVPSEDWLSLHAARHGRSAAPMAVVGRIDWHASIRETPFLRYINEFGPQFGFALMAPDVPLEPKFWYSSNLSIPTACLVEHRFDERFTGAAWEDIELGMRLADAQVPLVFEPAARVQHWHPTSLRTFLQRQRRVGAAAATFRAVRPEAESFLRGSPWPRALVSRVLLSSLTGLGQALDNAGLDVPGLWRMLCHTAYQQGWSAGRAGRSDTLP